VSTDAVIVMTTVEAPSDIPRRLVDERLAACVQEVPIASTYRWDGEVTRATEVLVLIKTVADRSEAVVRWLEENHPYDIPEIVVLADASARGTYLGWLVGETRPGG
jgi:periplasmic divalent cation tolerance protein